jgi:hypothetical protein
MEPEILQYSATGPYPELEYATPFLTILSP